MPAFGKVSLAFTLASRIVVSHAYAVSPSSTHLDKRRARRTVTPQQTIPTDPVESAKMAGLRYVTDTGPGIRREREGESFIYIGLDGKPIRDPKELDRIKSL